MTTESPFDYQHIAVREFMKVGNQVCPASPAIPPQSIRMLRARLIMEEAIETVEALGFAVAFDPEDGLLFAIKGEPSIIEIADGCADLKVVTVGTEIACGINGMPIFKEVMRSNMTKDFSGAKRPDGKILKGATYEPPMIDEVLIAQGWSKF